MKRWALVLMVVCAFFVVSCGEDPRDAADARRTDAITAADVADRELAREIKLAQEQARAERWNRIADALTKGFVFGGSFAAAILIISAGIGGSIALMGMGKAVSDAASFRAGWVPLDKTTRQYPLLKQWVAEDGRKLLNFGKGIYMLSNPNTGSVVGLDEKRAEDRQMIAGMIAAQNVGIVATASRMAGDSSSEGVGIVAPAAAQIITANSKYLEVGDGE